MNIILGSASPRRKKMLSGFFKNLKVISPSINENVLAEETPEEFTARISQEKALSIRKNNRLNFPSLLITSDTVVAVDEMILGKPSNYSDAVNMLRMLSSKRHRVISSITLEYLDEDLLKSYTDCEVTIVGFRELSDKSIEEYLGRIDFLDKAGSYAIQESGELIIDSVEGSVTNVIGFPLRKFFSMIAEMNLLGVLFQFIPAKTGKSPKTTCS